VWLDRNERWIIVKFWSFVHYKRANAAQLAFSQCLHYNLQLPSGYLLAQDVMTPWD